MSPMRRPSSTVICPPPATRVAAGRRPTNDQRAQRSPCSTDSSRKPGSSPTTRRNADTGVTRSASTSRHTGTTVWVAASLRKVSRSGRSGADIGPRHPAVEATAVAGVASAATLLLDDEQQRVAVAVVEGVAHVLAVTGRLALPPGLLPGPAPEAGAARLQGLAQGVLV